MHMQWLLLRARAGCTEGKRSQSVSPITNQIFFQVSPWQNKEGSELNSYLETKEKKLKWAKGKAFSKCEKNHADIDDGPLRSDYF